MLNILTKLVCNLVGKRLNVICVRRCHSVFGLKDLIAPERQRENFNFHLVTSAHHQMALDVIKRHYLSEHVLVRSRSMNLIDDRALDEYLIGLIKQGNTMYATADDDNVAGICVGFASSPVDAMNLRTYAFYRQDPNTKDFLYFTAKLQETPNLWGTFNQKKIYEIRMLAVVPEYRRQGLAVSLVQRSMECGHDQGYNVVRMDCLNPYDYKVAERCMLQCIVKFPLHKLRGANAPFVKRSSPHNRYVRVYVAARQMPDVPELKDIRQRREDMESLIE